MLTKQIFQQSQALRSGGSDMKRVRFAEPEEFIADCGVVFDHALSDCLEEEEPRGNDDVRRHLEIIKKDDEESFVRLLSTCPEACTKEHFDGYSALHVAVREGAIRITEHILLSGIFDVDETSAGYDALRPLALAIQANHCDIVALLLDAGASEFSLNVYNDSAVYAAVYNRQLSVLKLLVSRGCDCNYQNEKKEKNHEGHVSSRFVFSAWSLEHESPLAVALRQNCADSVRLLVEGGVSLQGEMLACAMRGAITHNGIGDAIRELLRSLSALGFCDESLLRDWFRYAHRLENAEALKELLPYIKDEKVLESGMDSAITTSITMVALLLGAGVQVTTSHLDTAARRCLPDMLKYLLEHCPSHRVRQMTSLYGVVQGRPFHSITSIPRFARRCGPDERDRTSHIHSSVLKVTQLLLDHGVAVDMRTQDTHDSPTALHASLDMGLVCVSLFLLMAGADPASVDKSGNTPFFTIARQLLQIEQMHWKKKENLIRLLQGLKVITSSPSRESTKIGALLTRPDYSATLAKLPDRARAILTETNFQPLSLTKICRSCIVTAMAPNSHTKVPKLGLPTSIQKFLLFRDLDEMLLELAGRRRKNNNDAVCVSLSTGGLTESSDSEGDEDKDYSPPVVRKKKKKKARSMALPTPPPAPKCRPKRCLCTV